jgi:hypothetical protein
MVLVAPEFEAVLLCVAFKLPFVNVTLAVVPSNVASTADAGIVGA